MTKEQCQICGAFEAEHKVKNVPFEYKGHTFHIDQPAIWCDACGEGIISSLDDKSVLLDIQEHKARIEGLLTPKTIVKIRKKLKLNQKEASQLFGGGINSFNRYESGVYSIPRPLSLLLTLLDHHPEQLNELRTYQSNNDYYEQRQTGG